MQTLNLPAHSLGKEFPQEKKYLWTKNRWTDVKNWAVVRDGRGGEDTPNLYCEWVLGASLLAFELPLRTEGGGVQKDRYVGPLVIFRRDRKSVV